MALLFAVSMGVNVYVTSGSEGKISRATALGAKGGVNYKEEAWEKKINNMVKENTPERGWMDAVIDGAGGDIVSKAGRILKVCMYRCMVVLPLRHSVTPHTPLYLLPRIHLPISHLPLHTNPPRAPTTPSNHPLLST